MSQDSQVDMNVQIALARHPTAEYPSKDEGVFQIKYVPPIPIDQVADGEVVVKNEYLSIDATMRVWISGAKSYMQPMKPGDLMKGMGVAEVIYSKSPKFKVGDKVLGVTYWQKYSVLKARELTLIPKNFPNKPYDFLGVLGISGLTAYYGLHKIGKIQKGESVVVSTAAGAVGEIAVQLAKLAGCKVCGLAGSDEKCEYVKSIGADWVINYKKESIQQKLKTIFPKGVDVYFDNVGGKILDDILMHIRQKSRIIACGAISGYSDIGTKKQPYRLKNYSRIIIKRAVIQGYLYFDYSKEFPATIVELATLIQDGKLKSRIDMLQGLEEAPNGLKMLLSGENNGKVIIQVNKEHVEAKL